MTPATPASARLIANLANADPQLQASLRPAAAAEIDALEQLAGQPLPPDYREFLALMGHGMGWLQPARLRLDIDALQHQLKIWRPPPGVLLIGVAQDDPWLDVYLEADGTGTFRVVSMPQGPFDNAAEFASARATSHGPLAGSLLQFLGTRAYRTLRMALLPQAIRSTTGVLAERAIDWLPTLVQPLGFRMSWFSNDWAQVYDSADAGLIATQFPGSVLALDIAASSVQRRDAIARLRVTRWAFRCGGCEGK